MKNLGIIVIMTNKFAPSLSVFFYILLMGIFNMDRVYAEPALWSDPKWCGKTKYGGLKNATFKREARLAINDWNKVIKKYTATKFRFVPKSTAYNDKSGERENYIDLVWGDWNKDAFELAMANKRSLKSTSIQGFSNTEEPEEACGGFGKMFSAEILFNRNVNFTAEWSEHSIKDKTYWFRHIAWHELGHATPQVRLNWSYQILPKSVQDLGGFIFSAFLT